MKEIEAMPGKSNWARVDAMTDEEALQNALSDPDAQPISDENAHLFRRVPRTKKLRRTLGLTQEEFAERYTLSLGTIRDWEQRRSEPDAAAKSYLRLIAKDPKWVAYALARKPHPVATE